MNYHIIVQDKFFNIYIEDIYRINQECNNVIWVRGNKGDSNVFQTDRPVEYLGDDPQKYIDKLQILTESDKLIVAWYDTFIGRVVSEAKIPCSLYVYLLGGDFYAEPLWWHAQWLYDSKTLSKMKETYLKPMLYAPPTWCKPYRVLTNKLRYRSFMREVKKKYLEKDDTMSIIDYIVLTEHSDKEIEFVKKLYPSCHAVHVPGVFDQNFDIAKSCPMKLIPEETEPLKILFGNSADPSGNHLDAIHYIKNSNLRDQKIYSFLSYGDSMSRQWTIEYANEQIGENFHPVTEYMNRVEFVNFMNKMDVLMMYHNRQQAEGNIMTALVLGKPVFIKPSNPQYGMLKRMGVKPVYSVMDMKKTNIREAIRFAQENRKDTINKIFKEYSQDTRLKHLKKILE